MAKSIPPLTTHVVHSLAELNRHAAALSRLLQGGEIIGLKGPLGAGKTEFARALIRELVPGCEVSSPSFTIENIYDVKNRTFSTINHLDLYRLPEASTFPELDEYSSNTACVSLIEWPERISGIKISLELSIAFHESGNPNSPYFTYTGPKLARL